jgi:hypothetical protein
MSAMVGYRLLYSTVTRNLTAESKIRVDALLGLPGAVEAEAEHRADLAAAAGFEVG